MLTAVLILAVVALAWCNGANDNFKGVATLYGSATCGYRTALWWATAATVLGSVTSIALAHGLIKTFSGGDLFTHGVVSEHLLAAAGLASAATILLATVLGMPTSTTHALTGALVGAALVSDGGAVRWASVAGKFAQPLLLSPLIAIAATVILYVPLRRFRQVAGIERESCICVGAAAGAPPPVAAMPGASTLSIANGKRLIVSVDHVDGCVDRYSGRFVGVDAQSALNVAHYASAAAVCFARAVNDVPKIAALLLAFTAVGGISQMGVLLLVTLAMTIGGLVQSRKVARTISQRITSLNPGQGFTANFVTAILVIGASRIGVPVSTTHVSCGCIFGISAVNGDRRWRVIAQILVTWLTTLPLGLALGAGAYSVIRLMGA